MRIHSHGTKAPLADRRRFGGLNLCFGAVLAGIGVLSLPIGAAAADDKAWRTVQQGIAVELEIASDSGVAAGVPARFAFRLHDAATGNGSTGLRPVAWLATRDPADATDQRLCHRKARTLFGGSLFSRPELDLNGYQVLMLNEDAALTVVDPYFGFGTSRLLATIDLPSPAFDWSADSERGRIHLSLPEVDQVVSVDSGNWHLASVEAEARRHWQRPERLALAPDGHYLWVAVRGGVAALVAETLVTAAVIPTHPDQDAPPSDLVFSADGRRLFVSHRQTTSLAVIDAARLAVETMIELDARPQSAAYSSLARRLYLTLAGAGPDGIGQIAVVDGRAPNKAIRLPAPPDPGLIRFAGDGRWGLIVHPGSRRLSILDSAQNRVIQTARLEGSPDQIAFSNELAYLRLGDRTQLLMVPLAAIGQAGQAIPTFDTVGGDRGFIEGFRPLAAAGIAPVPSGDAVLIANPGDRTVYFYKEGLAAPMGQLDNGGRSPRAVMAIDRSLRERSQAGRYETVATLPAAGEYDVVLFVDTPRIVHCFPLSIASAVLEHGHD